MRRRFFVALLALLALVAASSVSLPSNASASEDSNLSLDFRATLAWQIALEREGFSPGLITGYPNSKTTRAIAEYQNAHNLPASGIPDAATAQLLTINPAVIQSYQITALDLAQVTGVPSDWNLRAKLTFSGYKCLEELVAEKFHTAQFCLEKLNPLISMSRLKVGDVLMVPAIPAPKPLGAIARLEINQDEKTIRAFDAQNKPIALFNCSIAEHPDKRPTGRTQVKIIMWDPPYNFDPAIWPEVKNVPGIVVIPPGPRNPVGVCWVGLELYGYGIHGTPYPELIGQTGSHGCFRLTNWDAQRLGHAVQTGIPVDFVDSRSKALTNNLETSEETKDSVAQAHP